MLFIGHGPKISSVFPLSSRRYSLSGILLLPVPKNPSDGIVPDQAHGDVLHADIIRVGDDAAVRTLRHDVFQGHVPDMPLRKPADVNRLSVGRGAEQICDRDVSNVGRILCDLFRMHPVKVLLAIALIDVDHTAKPDALLYLRVPIRQRAVVIGDVLDVASLTPAVLHRGDAEGIRKRAVLHKDIPDACGGLASDGNAKAEEKPAV